MASSSSSLSRRMDINSLLSPSESPAPATPPEPPHVKHFPGEAAVKRPGRPRKNHTSSLLGQATAAAPPLRQTGRSAPVVSKNGIARHDFGAPAAPTSAPAPQPLRNGFKPAPGATDASRHAMNSTIDSQTSSSLHSSPPKRNDSTEKIDMLANLASMQNPQQIGSHSNQQNFRNGDSKSSQSPTTTYSYTYAASNSSDPDRRPSSSSSRKGSIIPADLPMSDIPTATLEPRAFMANSLSQEELDQISTLTQSLSENTFLYDSHKTLIELLHKGLVAHTSPPNDSSKWQDPTRYALKQELRQAREAMDSRFTLGEVLMVEWIHDEIMLARTVEDRIAVMELCQKGVQEEKGSSTLWRLYGDWMWLLYKTTHDVDDIYSPNFLEQHPQVGKVLASQPMSQEEKHIGREVFGWDHMLNVWQQGVNATQWHINDSHLVFDPYLEILVNQLSLEASPEKLNYVTGLFADRLAQPHATWDNTFQMFSRYIRQHHNADDYETTMMNANQKGAAAKEAYQLRQVSEDSLANSIAVKDEQTEGSVLVRYLEWEARQANKKNAPPFATNLLIGLFERANIRFPTYADFWEDHLDFFTLNPQFKRAVLDLAHRATRHCPWSGMLWSKHLSAMELSEKEFSEIENVKHHATSTGLLEKVAEMTDIIEVFSTWCGFLRRRAFSPTADEDERDIAEVGIRSAIEDVRAIGEKRIGKHYTGDPLFRMERIYAKFLYQVGRIDDSRKIFQDLEKTHGDDWTYWDKFYTFEMTLWGRSLGESASAKGAPPTPVRATGLLELALKRPKLDWPEKLLEMYAHHIKQHESVAKVQESQALARRFSKNIQKRRANEIAEAAQQQEEYEQATQELEQGTAVDDSQTHEPAAAGKRKRDESPQPEIQAPKKSRSSQSGEAKPKFDEESSSATQQIKRDREHTTIQLRKLPSDTTEDMVRKFLKGCGNMLSLHLRKDKNEDSMVAIIEFETRDDVLAAFTQEKKPFHGQEIEMKQGSGSTLWLANYAPEADEGWVRELLAPYGEVIEVRFPSLQSNTHRRFCYVQFLSSDQVLKASDALDGKELSGKLGGKYKLMAKVSDPGAAQKRSGATEEGREVYIRNLAYETTKDQLKKIFEKFGKIESTKVPSDRKGNNKGIAFVVFATKEESQAAVKEVNGSVLDKRVLNVQIASSSAKPAKGISSTVFKTVKEGGEERDDSASRLSPKSSKIPNTNENGLLSPASPDESEEPKESTGENRPDYHRRTVSLSKVPDTVNDARIHALLSEFGTIVKITMAPKKNEARVEFESLESASTAVAKMNGYEIIPGTQISARLFDDVRRGGNTSRGGRGKPGVGASTRGRAGGALGFRPRIQTTGASRGRGGLSFVAASGSTGTGSSEAQPKSNDYFKNLVKGNTQGSAEEGKDKDDTSGDPAATT